MGKTDEIKREARKEKRKTGKSYMTERKQKMAKKTEQ